MRRNPRSLTTTCSVAAFAFVLLLVMSSQTLCGEPVGEAKATGSLTVTIKPRAAKQAGARWRVDGGAWKKSGSTVSGLSIGQHTVTFLSIVGWNTPDEKEASIEPNQTITFRGKYIVSAVGPTAAFGAEPTSGNAPLDVQFTDQSTPGSSPITSWAWDFNNDGTVDSTEQNPKPTIQDTGVYDVKLTVYSASGFNSITKNDCINVTSANSATINLPGNVPLEMVWIPAGTFMMGRYANEQDSQSNESPQHQVTIASGFWMGKYEVTKAQWNAVMNTTPWSGLGYVITEPNSPAVFVSWNDAQSFVAALNTHITDTGQGAATFHLPSEAQWEYACRAGTTTRFYWGNDSTYTDIGNFAWWSGNAWSANERYAHVVGLKVPNAWGLYDMTGNAWEWCEDWYHSNYTGAPTDGSAWVSPAGSLRVGRGGSWFNVAHNCRSAQRSNNTPWNVSNILGFRLAR